MTEGSGSVEWPGVEISEMLEMLALSATPATMERRTELTDSLTLNAHTHTHTHTHARTHRHTHLQLSSQPAHLCSLDLLREPH